MQFVANNRPVLGIRREDYNRWEARAPLSPAHVQKLVDRGVKVLVQPASKRAYSGKEYQAAGAHIREDLSEASVILGVKTVPPEELLPNKTYAFFSHTIKAQEANMPMLDAILEKNIRIFDYEMMLDEAGVSPVAGAMGRLAGISGMINILHAMGTRLLALGNYTPFLRIGPTHSYRNIEMCRQAVRDCGYDLALGRMPESMGPLTFLFTGSGYVSKGAQEMLKELPVQFVDPTELRDVCASGDTTRVYAAVLRRHHHLRQRDSGQYDEKEYTAHPDRYVSTFAQQFAPYVSCLVNGMYWPPTAPRLLTNADLQGLLGNNATDNGGPGEVLGCPRLPHRLIAVSDISADEGGSLEFMTRCTSMDSQFEVSDGTKSVPGIMGDGVVVCSVDNLPAQLPREATDIFGDQLLPYVWEMLHSMAEVPFESQAHLFCRTLQDATIASNGKLRPKYEYISELRASKNKLQ
ncbi:PREDICTED: alpha-aminoadipic semialdehyde synthase, mitochondrial-like isoform X2 [Branchiostoma belcheri]|nr:PREDICTED: alpha-aminoadipic semialdehyde synthase, mitochondrial-like isoform X2 [Branchiostoma belcheri]XP_019634664.1 PREDICTED: alpha-aminoadipic semialdehyde synthase, mitochondrial-like isoform X2 [Branchiostoma belcheri]